MKMGRNTILQIMQFKTNIAVVEPAVFGKFPFVEAPYRKSLQSSELWKAPTLDRLNEFYVIVVIASLAVMLIYRNNAPELVLMVLSCLFINAFATGALGGVVGRYEGRGIWLLML